MTMTAATANRTTDGFEERTAPELLKWSAENKGKQIQGVFRSLEEVEVTDPATKEKKKVWQYTLESESGSGSVKFIATYDLLQKLTRKDIGKVVRITYTGDDESVAKNGNPMKVFSVFVKANSGKNAHGLEVSDADIPF